MNPPAYPGTLKGGWDARRGPTEADSSVWWWSSDILFIMVDKGERGALCGQPGWMEMSPKRPTIPGVCVLRNPSSIHHTPLWLRGGVGGSTPIMGGGGRGGLLQWIGRFPGVHGTDSSKDGEPNPRGMDPCSVSSVTEDPGPPVTIETRD